MEPRGDAVRWRIIAADDCPGPAQIRQSPCAILTIPRFFARAAHPDNFSTFSLRRDEKLKASKSQGRADHRAKQIKKKTKPQKIASPAVGSARGDNVRLWAGRILPTRPKGCAGRAN